MQDQIPQLQNAGQKLMNRKMQGLEDEADHLKNADACCTLD